jgi:hypothetical protein
MEPATVTTRPEPRTSSPTNDPRAARILARSLYKEMVENGVASEQILAVASELIGLVTEQLKESQVDRSGKA